MFAKESGTLTDHNEVANDMEARKRERAKYHFPTALEYRDRIAASFLKGRYILPSGLDRGNTHEHNNKENIASLTSKQNADCQTEVTTTRDVGLGDGDIDALPPERTIDIPTGLPDVAEFPILSLPQQLEAEKRLQGLLARVEEEINRVAEEARREAAKNSAKNPTQATKSNDTFLSNEEWSSRMMSAVTNRLRGKHQQFDEDLALSQATYLQTFVRQHKIGLKAEEGTRRYDAPTTSKWVEQQEEPHVINQTITPAVQHVLKMKPMLGAGIHFDPTQYEQQEDITSPASIANRAAQRKAEAARPLTRGLRIALSKQRYYTIKPGQRESSPPGTATGLPQMGRKSVSGEELLAPSAATLKEASPESGSKRSLRQRSGSTPRSNPADYVAPRSLRDSHGIPSPRR